jgi:hypothetical protein
MYWHFPSTAWWIIVPFVVWRIVVRLRRLLVRQRFSLAIQWGRVVSLVVLTIFVALVAFAENPSSIALAAGLAVGALLGAWGVRLTTFEQVDGELHFQPDRYLGLALSLLLLGRIAWRLAGGPIDQEGWTLAAFVRNPSTMLLFGLFSAHFIVYALGLIYWAKRRPR